MSFLVWYVEEVVYVFLGIYLYLSIGLFTSVLTGDNADIWRWPRFLIEQRKKRAK